MSPDISARVVPPPSIPLIAGFESTYLPLHEIDIVESTGHDHHWPQDLTDLRGHVRALRYPIRWHRVEAERGHYDWRTGIGSTHRPTWPLRRS